MCFSANASFGSAAILSVVGIACMRKAGTPAQTAFAAIPFIFGFQQLSEGFVWLSLTNPAFINWQKASTYIFLGFAHVVWPIWVPLSILLIERNIKRKNILYFLLGAGVVLATYLGYTIVTQHSTASIEGYHIKYSRNFPANILMISGVFYILATVLPTFISSVKYMWLLGVSITASYVVASIFYHQYTVSVWCYFAAFLSAIVYLILYHVPKVAPAISLLKIQAHT